MIFAFCNSIYYFFQCVLDPFIFRHSAVLFSRAPRSHKVLCRFRGKAPIASMDAMEDMDLLSGSNTHLSKLSSELNMCPPPPPLPVRTTAPGIKHRQLGKSGLKVPNISLGSLKVFNQDNPEVSEEIITTAYENGINMFDLTDPWNLEKAERELGRILKKKGWPRRNYVVVSRIFWSKSQDKICSRKEILESVKQSLHNLQLDYIDLVIIHKCDPNVPVDEVVRACTYLIDNGMAMYWGTCKWSPVEIFETYSQSRSLGHIAPVCEIGEYHWFHREKVELYMAELYNKIGMGLMTWSPISFGLCLGKNDDHVQLFTKLSLKNQKFCKAIDTLNVSENNSEGQNRIKMLQGVAERIGCSISQLLIAWCVRNQTCQSVVASAGTVDELWEILNSLPIISKITLQVNEELDKILGNKPVRPPMISTLQQRWATSGGVVPPC